MAKKKKGFFSIVLSVITYLMLAFVLAVMAIGLLSRNNLNLPYTTYLIQSGSMEPSIMTGDVIVIKEFPVYLERDVVTFEDSKGHIVTHRIIEKNNTPSGNTFITQGDANQTQDVDPIKKQQIKGKVVFTIPRIGYLVKFSRTRLGLILFIMVPVVWLVFDEIKKIVAEVSQ